ncbi:zinc-binding dehydrogenase [Paraburkholderia xenovorans]|uniref:zinc-binding dehydrogenase n=1 Tax=Paraburkholderia xenovorans TaxID=36873 RepID=UPI0038B71F99
MPSPLAPGQAHNITARRSTLRSRTAADKATIINELERQIWPHIESGKIKPVVYKTFALADARGAHELIDSGTHFGKIVLTTGADLIGRSVACRHLGGRLARQIILSSASVVRVAGHARVASALSYTHPAALHRSRRRSSTRRPETRTHWYG